MWNVELNPMTMHANHTTYYFHEHKSAWPVQTSRETGLGALTSTDDIASHYARAHASEKRRNQDPSKGSDQGVG